MGSVKYMILEIYYIIIIHENMYLKISLRNVKTYNKNQIILNMISIFMHNFFILIMLILFTYFGYCRREIKLRFVD